MKKKIDYSKNIQLHNKVQNKPNEWRLGQAYFNYAYELYPRDVDTLRGSEVDCFYVDAKIPDFLDALNKQLLSLVEYNENGKRIVAEHNIYYDKNGNRIEEKLKD